MGNKKFNLLKFRDYVAEEANIKLDIKQNEESVKIFTNILNTSKEMYENHKNSCDHKLVLYIGKEDLYGKNNGCAYCLTCGAKIYVSADDRTNYDIIDIEGIINPEYLYFFENGENVLVRRAMKKLLSLSFVDDEMDLEDLKANIVEDLVYYTDDLEYRKIIPRKRARIISKK